MLPFHIPASTYLTISGGTTVLCALLSSTWDHVRGAKDNETHVHDRHGVREHAHSLAGWCMLVEGRKSIAPGAKVSLLQRCECQTSHEKDNTEVRAHVI